MRVFTLGEFHGDVIHRIDVDGAVFAITRRKRGETVPSHCHDHASIRALISGDHHYVDDSGGIRNSVPKAWYYSDPNHIHSHEACQTDITSIGIQFPQETFPNPPIIDSSVLRGASADFTLDLIQNHLKNPRSTSPSVLLATFHLLRAALVDEGQQNTSNIPPWLTKLKATLDSKYLEPINVEKLSQEIGIHPSHMARAFRAEFGLTITGYIRDRRLEWSLDQIKNSNAKLGIVATQAGFADQSHFSREFKRRYGHNPSNYR